MEIQKSPKAGVSAASAASFPRSEKRQAEIDALQTATIGALKGKFREFDVILLVSGSIRTASDDFIFAGWPRVLDRVVYYMRLSSKDLGVALCDAAERAVVVQAKQLKLVDADYEAHPRD